MPSTSIPVDGLARLQWLKACEADHLATMPSVLETLSQLPNNEGLDALARLKYVAYSGCSMKGSLGDRVAAAGVRLSSIYGCTEAGFLSSFRYFSDEHDWRYFALRQDIAVRATKPSIIINNTDPAGDNAADGGGHYKFIVDIPGWSTPFDVQDDVLASTSMPGLYTVRGRLDDVIVLSHGQNVRPHVVESALTDSPLVKAAVAFGSERPAREVCVGQMAAFVDSLFALLQGISNSSREDIHHREAPVVLPHDAEVSATEKGSVKRRQMLQIYESQIEEAYQKIGIA